MMYITMLEGRGNLASHAHDLSPPPHGFPEHALVHLPKANQEPWNPSNKF